MRVVCMRFLARGLHAFLPRIPPLMRVHALALVRTVHLHTRMHVVGGSRGTRPLGDYECMQS